MEEFEKMPKHTQIFYIASELYESENPCREEIKLMNAMLKRGVVL